MYGDSVLTLKNRSRGAQGLGGGGVMRKKKRDS